MVYVDRQRWHRGSDVQADVRVDYVALSRARDEILRTEVSAWMRKDRRTRRWTARKRSRPDFAWAMETLAHDVEVARPAGATSDAAREIQQCLGRPDVYGAPVHGVLDRNSSRDDPVYELMLEDGSPIGRTSDDFGRGLVSVFGPRRTGQFWPSYLDGLALTAVETVAGGPEITAEAGLAGTGMWLVPRLSGMARPDWAGEERQDG